MKIFCIIVTYNGKKWIDWCLHSLQTSTVPVTPIIVDNGSTDNTLNIIGTHYPSSIVLPMNSNLGFGQANNKGIEYALSHGATHILLLNQDAAIKSNTIEKLLEHDNELQLLTPIHLNGDGTHIDQNFKFNTLIIGANHNYMLDDIFVTQELQKKYSITYVNAACWFFSIELIKLIGGFNPLFYHYSEDDNFINRLQYHHIPLFVVTDSFIFHDREIHGNENLYQCKKTFRRLLLCHTNINYSLQERIIRRYSIAFHTLGEAMQSRKVWQFIKDWIVADWELLMQHKRIQNSRTQEKKVMTNWLNFH